MNILINGGSVCRGEGSWPYLLQEKIPNCNIVNLALSAAGNTYIHETIVSEISQRPYDLVLAMWTYAERFDFRVKNIHQFDDTTTTSYYESQQNDWPSKKIYPINDQDYVQKNWVFSGNGEHFTRKRNDSVGRVLHEYYKVTGPKEHSFSTIMRIISLQNTLKTINVPYVFMSYRPMPRIKEYNSLYGMIDDNNFFTDTCLHGVAKKLNAFDDTFHPLPIAHQQYADQLHSHLIKNNYI
jgi:hypothetical protein